jgi:RNA polymerase sigma factor (sigma-70 family)
MKRVPYPKTSKSKAIDALVIAYQDNPCNETFAPVFAAMEQAVKGEIKRLHVHGPVQMDAYSRGCEALWRAAQPRYWDRTRGISFCAYGTRAVHTSIIRALKVDAMQRGKRDHLQVNEKLTIRNCRISQDEKADYSEKLADMREVLALIPASDRKLLEDRVAGRTLQEIADERGVCKERVRQKQEAVLAKLRKLMGLPAKDRSAPKGRQNSLSSFSRAPKVCKDPVADRRHIVKATDGRLKENRRSKTDAA